VGSGPEIGVRSDADGLAARNRSEGPAKTQRRCRIVPPFRTDRQGGERLEVDSPRLQFQRNVRIERNEEDST